MLASKTRWRQTNYSVDDVASFQKKLGVSALVAELFIARGWTELESTREMLHIDEKEFHDPYLLDGMKEAIDRIEEAIQNGQKIRIYGDYDCDGVSSTTLMIYVLRELGAKFDYYIPNRFTEGYGLNNGALDKAKAEGVQLIVTVDTGISAKEQIDYGNSIGLEIIVTDHHEPPAELPECVAVINPKKPNCSYPFPYLAGAGVTFKLAQALLKRIPYEYADIASIGTIADLVPLIGENRLIAYQGLKAINRTKHLGIEALIEVAGLRDEIIDEQKIGFSLGPRINASGRLETADKAVRLLISNDRDEASILAEEIDILNRQRKTIVDSITTEAVEWVEEKYPTIKPKALIVAKENWNVGVIGIVASRLVERYYVPTVVLSIAPEKGMAKGSARSIEGFDLYQALTECKEWLPHFGGHPMAAGMSLKIEDIDALRQRLAQLAEQWLTEEDFTPIKAIDITCSLDEITIEAIHELNQLAPYGVGNPKPKILLERLKIKELRQVGTDKQHLKCQFRAEDTEGKVLDGIGFGLGELAPKISMESKVDMIGELSINEWNGMRKPQIMIEDIRVPHRQYFDWRGAKNLSNKWEQISFDQHVAVCYFRERKAAIDIPSGYIALAFDEQGMLSAEQEVNLLEIDTFILYDLPSSLDQVKQAVFQLRQGQRYYLLFQHQEQHYFSTIPSREHFKWFYAFIQQKGSFDLKNNSVKLAEHKGWTKDAILFMAKVFLELEFATIEDGMIQLNPLMNKKELSHSKTYQQKQEEIKLEQNLIYSSYSELIQAFEGFMQEKESEEAFVYGF